MKYYLITTHHNKTTRHDYIRQHLKWIEYQSFLAIDHRVFHLEDSVSKHQSLTHAYLQIAQSAIFEGIKQYIVMEDDLHLEQGFFEELSKILRSLPEDADFCYLTKTKHNSEAGVVTPINEHISKVVDNWWETPITLWKTKAIETFEQTMMDKLAQSPILGNVDHELLKLCQQGKLNFYAANKNIANGLSNIDQAIISKQGAISNSENS